MHIYQNKIAIVTGGASGIGREICLQLAQAGARVVVADRDAAGAERVADEIRASAFTVDVRKRQRVEEMIAETVETHGRLDYIFNNAGIAVGGDARDLRIEAWQEIIDINLMGVIYGCQAAYPLMARQGHGHIVNTASLAGLIGFPGMTPYATTKAAVIGLSRSLRTEGKALGVRVSALCPGFVDSQIYESARCQNLNSGSMRALVSLPMLETGVAVRRLLKGVAANQELVVLPAYAQLLWKLSQLAPGLLDFVGQDMIKRLRQLRLSE